MLFLVKNNIKNDICNNAVVFVTRGYNERVSYIFINPTLYPYLM